MRAVKGLKWCASCAYELSVSVFRLDEQLPGGYAHVCRKCEGDLVAVQSWRRLANRIERAKFKLYR